MIASLAKSVPPLVDRHQTAFLENLHADLGQGGCLDRSFRTDLKRAIEGALGEADSEKKSLQIWNVADRLWFALLEAERERFKTLAGGERLNFRWIRSDRLSEEISPTAAPGRESPYGRPLETDLLLQELLPHCPLADRVVELENQGGLGVIEFHRDTHLALAQYGLNLYGESGERRLVRLPALSFMHSALIFCLGDQALRFYFTAGLELPQRLELQLLGYHPVALGYRPSESPHHTVDRTIQNLIQISRISTYVPLKIQKANYLFAQSCQELIDQKVIDSVFPDESLLSKRMTRRWLTGWINQLIHDVVFARFCDEGKSPLLDMTRLVNYLAGPESDMPAIGPIPNLEVTGCRQVLHQLLSSYLSRLEQRFPDEWHKELREHIRELRDLLKRKDFS